MAPSNKGESPSTPLRTSSNLTHRRHHSIANDTINDIVGGMNVAPIATPSSAPRMGRSSGGGGVSRNNNRHKSHKSHSHMDLDSIMDYDEGMAEWSIGSKNSAFAMAQYLDTVESSDQVHDICSFQDVNLDAAENGTVATANKNNTTPGRKQQQHLRHKSSDSFASNGSHDHHHHQGTPRRARKMYYLMPMMWKHRYHIVACITTFLVCVIAISASVKSSMNNNSPARNKYEPLVLDLEPPSKTYNDGEMVGPPLVIEEQPTDGTSENNSGGSGSSSIHKPQQPPPIEKDDEGGAAILGPGGAFEEEEMKSRTPCMTSIECEARSDLLKFPNYDEGPFEQKGCFYEGDFVYWGTGTTTTNDDEKDNDVTLEELTSHLSEGKHRLYCDEDAEMIAIDKVAAALSIAEGKLDAEQGVIDEDNIEFVDIPEGGGGGGGDDEDGVAIVGENFPMEEDTEVDGEDDGGTVVVGPPLQTDFNPEEDINAEWYSTDTELYISLIAEGMGPHETAMKFCENKGKTLCIYNDYCPGGKSSRVYQGGPDGVWIENSAESEQWAPIMAHSSESAAHKWVQIGRIVDGGDASENYGQCWTYEDWVNRDDANLKVEDSIEESHRRFFLCCDD